MNSSQQSDHSGSDCGGSVGPDMGMSSGQPASSHFVQQDTFRILLATDNHLGYMEKDPIRGEDSFNAFEEILQLAQDREVDMVILGGDLFHDNKPSQKSFHTAMSLLRQYCLGDKPCPIEILSDQSENFPDRFAVVNYQDPNYNVGIPVFSIHGNHDDPSGGGNLCALEVMSVSGLINYFGKQASLDEIHIKPILLRKGTSHLALYGLGNVRDERLNRLFRDRKVKMYRPKDFSDISSDSPGVFPQAPPLLSWFNMMVIHQNRTAHGRNNYIPEAYLADFLDLVLWGHEHQCLIDPTANDSKNFYVTQPGSSVATSLCEGESSTKHVGILSVQGTVFAVEKVRLKTVRPFIMDEVILSKVPGLYAKDQGTVNEFLHQKVADMIELARTNWQELNPNIDPANFPKPLIRLKVEYTGAFTTFNPQRFGHFYIDKVANPKDIISFYRKRTITKVKSSEFITLEPNLPDALDRLTIEDLVVQYLDAQKLEILPENELADAVLNQVEKNDKDSIKVFLDRTLSETKKAIRARIAPHLGSSIGSFSTSTGVARKPVTSQSRRGSIDRDVIDEDREAFVDVEDTDQLDREIARVKSCLVDAYAAREPTAENSGWDDIRRGVEAVRTVRHTQQEDLDDFYEFQEPAAPPTRKRITSTTRSTAAKTFSNANSHAALAVDEFENSDGMDDDGYYNSGKSTTRSTVAARASRASAATRLRNRRESDDDDVDDVGRTESRVVSNSKPASKGRGRPAKSDSTTISSRTARTTLLSKGITTDLESQDMFGELRDTPPPCRDSVSSSISSISTSRRSTRTKPLASTVSRSAIAREIVPETQHYQENDDDISDDVFPNVAVPASISALSSIASGGRGRKRELPSSLKPGGGASSLTGKRQTTLRFMSSQQAGDSGASHYDSNNADAGTHTLKEFANMDKRSRKK
ncbi:hypothetical protein BASA50_001330 [Batrachochytrium salamandrivorans]|uniref:Mre11 DNA-binding domain-containing protein n=1 Tax=Batrachochytrium salamandrivorans TaxID=1357716 RepID=A0ABQ8EVC9_9FUNG|nr:hypothetical protein BASA50_001330 [Batrachochytrium salamandrivorans]KAH9275075.1 DNA repair protein (mre11) [Batrachochytrium salamandrivorans]